MWWPIHGPARALTTAPNGYRYQVFISYTTRESEVQLVKPFVDDLVYRLEERGIPIYYDGWYLARRQYEPYQLAHLLKDAIESSAFTLAFVSPGYIDSDWCAFEWETTYLLHQPRPRPAQEYSLLPVVWKPLMVRGINCEPNRWRSTSSPARSSTPCGGCAGIRVCACST
jgi:hypothetical protein